MDKRHSELFRKFLTNTFGIENPDKIQFADFTKKFVADYLTHSCNDSALYASAFLSLGTEGIVGALYARLIDGMVKSGIASAELDFFKMHVDRDDEIAETLGELMFWYWGKDPNWASTCRLAADCALNLRKQFFDQLYASMHERRMQMNKCMNTPLHSTRCCSALPSLARLTSSSLPPSSPLLPVARS